MLIHDETATVSNVDDVVAEHGPFILTSTGVVASREDTFEEWQEAAEWVQLVQEASPFWVGDLIEHGAAKHGEKYSQALRATGYAEQTVKNAAYVARSIPRSNRRSDVPFSHHAEVAPLSPDDQKRWLDRCRAEGLTRERLRLELKAEKSAAAGHPVELWVMVRCKDIDDQSKLADLMRGEGRDVRLMSKESRPVEREDNEDREDREED